MILIATQVVEVSLDIDFAYGYFEACPIDALVQRMGRINRKGKQLYSAYHESNIAIFTKALHDKLIYSEELVQKTIEVLYPFQKVPLSEMELCNYINQVYPEYLPVDEVEFQRGIENSNVIHHEDNMEIGFQQEWVNELIDQADAHIDVLPEVNKAVFIDFWNRGEYLEAKKLLLSIHRRRLKRGDLEALPNPDIFVIKDCVFTYNAEYGLKRR